MRTKPTRLIVTVSLVVLILAFVVWILWVDARPVMELLGWLAFGVVPVLWFLELWRGRKGDADSGSPES